MPHIAAGGVWTTAVTLVNTGDSMADFPLRFFTPTGAPWEVFVEGLGTASEFPISLAAGNAIDLVLPSRDEIIRTGWAEIDQPVGSALGGHAIFTDQTPGRPVFEALVPLVDGGDNEFLLPFDNTNGNNTCLALANSSDAQSTTASLDFRDQLANSIISRAVDLSSGNQTAFCLVDDHPALVGKKGVLSVSGSGPKLSVLAFRFNPGGAFTTFLRTAR